MKIILLGNAGAGKSTFARRIIASRKIPRLSLDQIAWQEGSERKPLKTSEDALREFILANDQWILEGCYGSLVTVSLPHADLLIFLNPGVDVCIKHCLSRPWEPEKFSSADEQNQNLDNLIQWVRQYESRDDEYGLKYHQDLFSKYNGEKYMLTSEEEYEKFLDNQRI